MKRSLIACLLTGTLCGTALPAFAQQGDGTNVTMSTTIFKPAKVPATPERMATIKAPPGFMVTAFATGLKNARVLATAPDGAIYLSRRDQGDVLLLRDRDGDGKADGAPITVANRAGAHGIAVHDGQFYLVTVKELFVADILSDGRLGPLKLLAGDLPDGGQHGNRTLAWGPDDMLYISAGSTCNACNESNPESATILRVAPDGKSRTIFASGLRNTIGFGWQPQTGELWGFDNGIDYLGDDDQPEEFNKIEHGKQYGWPHAYGANKIYPQTTPPGDITKEEWAARSAPMTLGYAAHAAPMEMLFYSGGSFPAEFNGDAFVTMRGSWNRKAPTGYEIVRIRFNQGQAQSIEPFVSGFLSDGGQTHFARPMGLTMAKDGALLMADDANGVIYRIAYAGASGAAAAPALPPGDAMLRQATMGSGVELALKRVGARDDKAIKVKSSGFGNQSAIPLKYTEYADGVSPPLSWSPVPGAVSYVIIAEDPDARPIVPFVH